MNDLFEKIINHAISYKTSDIHFLLKQQCIISFRQNGRLTQYDVLDYNLGIKLNTDGAVYYLNEKDLVKNKIN